MLFTRKGDDGTTYTFDSKKRFFKDSKLGDALGNFDEINSLLGVCKVKVGGSNIENYGQFIDELQHNLFIVQAELAGVDKTITKDKVKKMEDVIADIEKELPEICTFCVSGSCELSALLDFARTVVRRAERSLVSVRKEVSKDTLAYVNRSSSLLYALARLSACKNDIKEDAPTYK